MIHTETTFKTKEKIVGGVQEVLMEEGDTVTWEAIHFGKTTINSTDCRAA